MGRSKRLEASEEARTAPAMRPTRSWRSSLTSARRSDHELLSHALPSPARRLETHRAGFQGSICRLAVRFTVDAVVAAVGPGRVLAFIREDSGREAGCCLARLGLRPADGLRSVAVAGILRRHHAGDGLRACSAQSHEEHGVPDGADPGHGSLCGAGDTNVWDCGAAARARFPRSLGPYSCTSSISSDYPSAVHDRGCLVPIVRQYRLPRYLPGDRAPDGPADVSLPHRVH